MAHFDQAHHGSPSSAAGAIAVLISFASVLSGIFHDCSNIERQVEAQKTHF
jgi:hypothetical protein